MSCVANVKRQKLTKSRTCVVQSERRSLSIRYAEVLRLRQAVQALSQGKRCQIDRRRSGVSEAVRSRVFDLTYLTAVVIAMIGWPWMLIVG